MRHFFVVGTDTEVGKTFVCVALLSLARQRFARCVGLKPIAAGCEWIEEEWRNEDALALIEASGTTLPYATINPVALRPAIAPHIALAQADRRVSAAMLAEHCQGVARDHEFVLVEGAGGWFVPLGEEETLADLCRLLDYELILVVGMKLGCLNHALLTAAAIEHAGLRLAGWVANTVADPMPYLAENIATLQSRLAAPCLGQVPHLPGDAAAAAGHLNLDLLLHENRGVPGDTQSTAAPKG